MGYFDFEGKFDVALFDRSSFDYLIGVAQGHIIMPISAIAAVTRRIASASIPSRSAGVSTTERNAAVTIPERDVAVTRDSRNVSISLG